MKPPRIRPGRCGGSTRRNDKIRQSKRWSTDLVESGGSFNRPGMCIEFCEGWNGEKLMNSRGIDGPRCECECFEAGEIGDLSHQRTQQYLRIDGIRDVKICVSERRCCEVDASYVARDARGGKKLQASRKSHAIGVSLKVLVSSSHQYVKIVGRKEQGLENFQKSTIDHSETRKPGGVRSEIFRYGQPNFWRK